MKVFTIDETITVTETTSYQIKAKDEKEALEKFRYYGENLGSCSTNKKDGIVIVGVERGDL